MFNYSEVNAYITTEDLLIVAQWAIKYPHHMVSGIRREKGKRVYSVHFTCAQNGFNRTLEINDKNEVFVIKAEKQIFWMS